MKWPEVEKSAKNRFSYRHFVSRLHFAALEMTQTGAFIMYNWYEASNQQGPNFAGRMMSACALFKPLTARFYREGGAIKGSRGPGR